MLNLQARYIAVVNSDREAAAAFTEAAESHEPESKYEETNNLYKKDFDLNVIGPIAPSVGSSTTSLSKMAKLIKQRRELLLERLNAPYKSVIWNSSFVLIFYLGLTVAASVLGYFILRDINLKLSYFSQNLPRAVSQWTILCTRKMFYYAGNADMANFNTTATQLKSQYEKWNSKVLPLFIDGKGSDYTTTINVWKGDHYIPKEVNAFEVTSLYRNAIANVMLQPYFFFQNSTTGLMDSDVRLRNFFTDIRMEEIQEYTNSCTLKMQFVSICLGVLLALVVVYGVLYTFKKFRDFEER
jgi:hypothetical protein